MLLDPFEKQLDLPTAAIQLGDGLCRQVGVVGQEDQCLAFRILDADTPQRIGIMLSGIETGQRTDLVADDTRCSVGVARVATLELEIQLGANHEETARLMQGVQSLEVQIAAIHDVESARLWNQHIQHVDLVPLAVRDMDEAGNVAAQVEQRMQFDRCLGCAEWRPWKHRQAQVDGRGIQCIDGLRQIETEGLVDIKLACNANQTLSEICVDAPIPHSVGIGQGIARDRAAKSHMVKLGRLAAQAGFDVSQTLAIGQLCERHTQELIQAGELFDLVFPAIACNAAAESSQRKVRHELRKNEFAGVHWMASQSAWLKPTCYVPVSNRDQANSPDYFVCSTRYSASFV